VKNPVLPHGASSKEKAFSAIHPLPLGRAPALPSGASWLFHVKAYQVKDDVDILLPTIKEIAQKAGVSYSTVSRALNDKRGVRADLGELIKRIASDVS
jgi:transcriptional regulator with XRE-family HTH domain